MTALEKYEHERWHKLAQDLQPLVLLPERITRDIAKMQGTFDGRISSISNEIQRSITAAVEKAIEPVDADLAALKVEVAALQDDRIRRDGATGVIQAILKSPALGWLVGAAITAWAVLTGRVHI